MRVVPASNSPFLPYVPPGTGPVFPAGPQPLIYLHHQYGFAADGSEWTSRIGSAKAMQPDLAKRPTVTAGGLYSDGARAMQTGVLPLASAPALTVILAIDLPTTVSGILAEIGADYHNGQAFAFLSETNGRVYVPYANGAEVAEAVIRTAATDTLIMRLRPASGAGSAAAQTLQSLAVGYGSRYYSTGAPAYALADNVLNLFARNNTAGPAGLAIRQVLIFPAVLTEAQVNEWVATF